LSQLAFNIEITHERYQVSEDAADFSKLLIGNYSHWHTDCREARDSSDLADFLSDRSRPDLLCCSCGWTVPEGVDSGRNPQESRYCWH